MDVFASEIQRYMESTRWLLLKGRRDDMIMSLLNFLGITKAGPWQAISFVAAALCAPVLIHAQNNSAGKANFVIRTDPKCVTST